MNQLAHAIRWSQRKRKPTKILTMLQARAQSRLRLHRRRPGAAATVAGSNKRVHRISLVYLFVFAVYSYSIYEFFFFGFRSHFDYILTMRFSWRFPFTCVFHRSLLPFSFNANDCNDYVFCLLHLLFSSLVLFLLRFFCSLNKYILATKYETNGPKETIEREKRKLAQITYAWCFDRFALLVWDAVRAISNNRLFPFAFSAISSFVFSFVASISLNCKFKWNFSHIHTRTQIRSSIVSFGLSIRFQWTKCNDCSIENNCFWIDNVFRLAALSCSLTLFIVFCPTFSIEFSGESSFVLNFKANQRRIQSN